MHRIRSKPSVFDLILYIKEREREREKEKQEVGVVSFDFEAFIIANVKIMEPTLARCVEFGGSPPPPKKGGILNDYEFKKKPN